uniref:Artemin n=1 Tax=Mastacembelus armatus TaxID=205130 RepID=A0A3Q3L7P1_9TELE
DKFWVKRPLAFLLSLSGSGEWDSLLASNGLVSVSPLHLTLADIQTQNSAPDPIIPIPARARRSTVDSQCGLRSILLQVRDLGLGYDSDEMILFKYCSGTCPRVRSNHDLTLTNLLLGGLLPHSTPGQLWHNAPCCRPTHHEDVAFLDNSHRWHKVEKLSASDCSCVG